ncbi:glycosyltransferase family 4 protein [Castellaniella sp.]|uniref:glycosyltransferase family 4 protein n=1 Tax=Castellaniella sp. TaxID=1955812 RepID=UPI0035601886
MKHVWILNHYAKVPGESGGTRHYHLAEGLKKHGWEATIIAASLANSESNMYMENNEGSCCKIVDNISFLWLKVPSYTGNGVRRIFNMFTYTFRVLKKKTTSKIPQPDVIIGSSVHPFAAMAGVILSRRYDVPFVFEVRDLWPQTLIDMGRLKNNSIVTKLLRMLEGWLYRNADYIVVLLPKAWEYIVPFGISRSKIIWIPNGVDLSLFREVTLPSESKNSEFTLMYFGAHGQANDLDNIIYAMDIVNKCPYGKNIKLRLIGNGVLKPSLIELSDKLALNNVVFEPAVPKKKVPTLAAQADGFIISVLDLPGLYRYGISMNKLFDYLAAMRPIIIASAAVNNPVADAKAGLTVEPNNPQALANAILKLSKMPLCIRQKMAISGRRYVELNHDFNLLAKKLSDTLDLAIQDRS